MDSASPNAHSSEFGGAQQSQPLLGRRDRQVVRLAVAFVGLSVIWGIAFNATALPFFPLVVVGGVVTGLVGFWVRRAPDEAEPGFAVTPRQAGIAVLAALVHFGIGHLLFAVAAQVVPALTATALEVYQRTDSMPVWGQLLLGAVLTAGLEEVFWRGAFTPMIAERVRPRLPTSFGTKRRGTAMVLVSTAGYALFHVATLKIALIAAAALGGLVWGTLLLLTRSVGVTIIAHVLWTSLMILFPPSLG
ncbi:CPBP family intramembrane glutamic endopeptidase [Euzebya tangerina]|uniref:CPBP family intramembrane glutamic endopeptidase n=1 Tax=Euzebya tangerina TaxID=591198 RepID=UPI000E320FDE|nr:CPBP family intramembrane glutamic endopeptidase [Euzebya tangerina]